MTWYREVWDCVVEHGSGARSLLHGPAHWTRVRRNGLYLAARTAGADVDCIALFALFHDSMRCNDGFDQGHGLRGAEFMRSCRKMLLARLSEEQFDLVFSACRDHTDCTNTGDPTVACCWDADRLDLPRCSITPRPEFFNTAAGRRMVEAGDFIPG